MNRFVELGLIEPLVRAVAAQGYEAPTPIQLQAIPPLLAGRDVLGCAQTGTGKTAAFALPVLQHLAAFRPGGRRVIRALVLTPTRELAAQIGDSFASYSKYLPLQHFVLFGGVSQVPQVKALGRGVDILVATPGRLLDLVAQGAMDLRHVEFFVLDEADRMLDMGFIRDVRRVLQLLPKQRQNLLFSATMPAGIAELAGTFLREPVRVEVTPPATTVEKIEQTVMFVDRSDKSHLLAALVRARRVEQAIVFTRTKHGANRLVTQLERHGLASVAIHGNKAQNARTRALDDFRSGRVPLLVATDIAARGLDIEGVSHVFNFDLPNEPESYVHRIGRTARAGRSGVAIAFCDPTETDFLRGIERIIGLEIEQDHDHQWHCAAAVLRRRPQPPAGRGGAGEGARRGGRGRRGQGGGSRGQGEQTRVTPHRTAPSR